MENERMSLDMKLRKWERYEAEGAAAALDGKTRDDCPYARGLTPEQDIAWNFWVYGNEMRQSDMIKAFMDAEGTPSFCMTTMGTPEEMEGLRAWGKKCEDAERRMREAKGWPVKD